MHFAKTTARNVMASLVGAILCSTGNAAAAKEPLKLAGSQLEPIKWEELAGWSTDDHLAAFAAYQASCQVLRKGHTDDHRPMHSALLNVCRKASEQLPQDAPPRRAEGGAHRQLLQTRVTPGQHEDGDVAAADQQENSRGAEEQHQGAFELAQQVVVQRLDFGMEAVGSECFGMFADDLLDEGLQLA